MTMPTYSNRDYVKLMRPIPSGWPKDTEGIPFVRKSALDISDLNNGKWLISVANINKTAKNLGRKIAHCFKFDGELDRLYRNPFLALEKMTKCYAASTFDVSMHEGMQRAQIIGATFKNRWSGVWLQMNGYDRVLVTVGWVKPDTYDVCFAGIENGTPLIISTLGACNGDSKTDFLLGYNEMRRRFPDSQVICLGKRLDGMGEDICYVEYGQSFGNFDSRHGYWQAKLFNWDFTEVK